MDLELNFAELALRSGDDAAAARGRYSTVLREAQEAGDEARATAALFGVALASEAEGDLLTAVEGFQRLADLPELPATVERAYVQMMLCRTYMTLGDLNRAIDVGEEALRECERSGGGINERLIRLAATLILCYYERDDLMRAQMLATKALEQAEALSSLDARGVVYWNAAYVAQAKGDIDEALRLTERALALFGELENRWATATLRRNAGWLMLQLPNADPEQAQPVLERALADLQEVGRPGDIAETESELARCCLLAGDLESASRFATAALERASQGTVLEHAKALLVVADVALAQGDAEGAAAGYRTAAMELDGANALRHAAAAWRQLGSLLMDLGQYAAAKDAYERLADATGVPKSPSGSRLIRSA